ncbi:MAG: lysophospholipid acyltransferase family protein [Thermodesulfobacteriota bacterium]
MEPSSIGHRPSRLDASLVRVALAPWRWLTAPELSGVEHVPRHRPVLFAGNHTTWAVLDAPLLLLALYERTGRFPRTLGDHLHFRIPGWRELVARFGVVDGTRENGRALMQAGESLVVFPGGAREVFKRRGEKYCLIWGKRTGFARLAIEFGYPIVPFSAVGAEDAYDILLDADDLLATPLGPVLRRLVARPELIPPIARGIGPTALPRPERLYFHFGEPVETRHLAGRQDEEEVAFAVREKVRRAVEDGIARLLLERERDPDHALLPRLLTRPLRRRRRRAHRDVTAVRT